MRRDGIPYVQNPKSYYPPIDINKLSLEEIRKRYIKTCGKANGNLSVCSHCPNPCAEGKRAIQLLANEVYNDPPVPLYGGKTLIEMAKEENKRKREEKEAKELEEKMTLKAETKPKRVRLEVDDWWEASLKAKDQVEYLMTTYNISKTQAKQKVYHAKRVKGLNETPETPKVEPEKKVEINEISKEVVKEAPRTAGNDIVAKTLELKIDSLMQQQAEYKAKMEEYKRKYEEVTESIDVLCKAMDVFDKT